MREQNIEKIVKTYQDFNTVEKYAYRATQKDFEAHQFLQSGCDHFCGLPGEIASRHPFSIWATKRLREYIIKGFTLDDERLKLNAGVAARPGAGSS